MAPPKIIVLDDDPTGSQTVHSCLLLTRWDSATLRAALQDPAPIFFILSNTRALPPSECQTVVQDICRQLKVALAVEGLDDYLLVSRSDSTLRGHYPLETDVIAAELGPFDAHFLVPAFFEGGRVTRQGVHYLLVAGDYLPVHLTEFSRDSVFGYHHSFLPAYVEEKTAGLIPAESVVHFSLPQVRAGILPQLLALQDNVCAVVDGEVQADLDRFAADLLTAVAQGKRFLCRSAASLLTALAHLPPQPVPPTAMGQYCWRHHPGVVLVGSHVAKTTQQLQYLLKEPGIQGVEVDLKALAQGEPLSLGPGLAALVARVEDIYQQGKTAVVYTSREELRFPDPSQRLRFGTLVSDLLMALVQQLPSEIGFLISKGGITSNDTLSRGLGLPTVRLLGQVIPGCSMVQTPDDHHRFPRLPVVLFPGNVGGPEALALVYRRLSQP